MMKPVVVGLLCAGAPALAEDIVFFQAPSGNIHCMMIDGEFAEARCDIRSFTPTYQTPPADCDLEWGDSFFVTPSARTGGLTCHGDTVFSSDSPVLGYGNRMEHGGLVCGVERGGVSCLNPAGHGFTLARAAQAVY